MPEPLSVTLLAGYAGLQLLASTGSALSNEARDLRDRASVMIRSASLSQALYGAKNLAISQLWELVQECAAANWDGERALPLSELAAAQAEQFIRLLPNGLPVPEVSADPDGSISLDWMPSRHRLFSLSVGESHRLPYAWVDGSDKGHAVARFDGERIPSRVIAGIEAITDRGDATVRAA